jgi:predicted glycosyltransferase
MSFHRLPKGTTALSSASPSPARKRPAAASRAHIRARLQQSAAVAIGGFYGLRTRYWRGEKACYFRGLAWCARELVRLRVLIWSQHLLGTGHLQRVGRLAAALAARGHAVTVANGGPAPVPRPAGWRRADLPAIRAADADFTGLVDGAGAPVGAALWARRRAVLAALAAEHPDVVVVEMFPFGRRAFARELAPLLDAWRARPRRPRLVVSLRDVLVDKRKPGRAAEVAARVVRWFDRVLVHADPRLVGLDASFPAARRIAPWLRYTGYVAPELAPRDDGGDGVVVSAGGGVVGRRLFEAALAAAHRLDGACGPWTLVGGRELPEPVWAALRAQAPAKVRLLRAVDDLPALLAGAAVSVSQAGYNTVAEAMALKRPMVLVPFARGDETEQTRRAEAVASIGAARLLSEGELDGVRLAAAVAARAAVPYPAFTLDVAGARHSARLLERLREGRA